MAPRSTDPITYRVYDADLEVTNRERTQASTSDAYRTRMLEIPLSREDRNYLETLAKRVGGSRSPTQQFAYRFANYFANRHPYSYFVTIPPGRGHSVVRWLENESPGLCSNYAAAFTLLARSRGIPTRVVGGFASNEFNAKENRYVLRQNNAHAWVEYLDESNRWIRFDPTPGISEAEIIRAEQYVTAGNRQSLQKLLASEAKATAEPPESPTLPPATSEAQAAGPAPALAADNAPQQKNKEAEAPPTPARAPAPSSRAAPEADEAATPPPTPRYAETAPREPAPAPSPEATKPAENSAASQAALTSTPAEQPHPPWLALLAILALLLPSVAYLMRFKKPPAASPEIHLRHQAGRLLAQLDALLQTHELADDPIWIETRQSLSEQRYGRQATPARVQDLAVKVALLAKRKKQK